MTQKHSPNKPPGDAREGAHGELGDAQTGAHGEPAAPSSVRAGSDDEPHPRTDHEPRGGAGGSRLAPAAHAAALGGLALYAFFAPGSIAAAWIAISIATLGWLARALVSRRANLSRSPLDLPLWLLFGWTVLSAFFSAEPDISLRKLPSAAAFLFFYVAQAVPRTRREVTWLGRALVAGACVCTLWGVGDLIIGRGVVIEEIAEGSLLRDTAMRGATRLQPGDCVWRVNGRRVDSTAEIDEAVRAAEVGSPLRLSVIARGEHVEWDGPPVTEAAKSAASPAGLRGTRRAHNFRASGWTRHYETFAETLQIAAQLALGFALAHLTRRGPPAARRRVVIYFAAAFALLACGLALTAMRTTLVAFSLGALVTAWRATARRPLKAETAGGTNDNAVNDGGANVGGTNVGDANTGGTNGGNASMGGTNNGETDNCVNVGGAGVGGANISGASIGDANIGDANAGGARLPYSMNRARVAVVGAVVVALSLGAFAVWRTRSAGALRLRDDSSRLRLEVARVAAGRVPERPVLGHGMDALHRHWAEWGFPGADMLHTHSTPLQLAFDRGLPALALWLWLLAAFWLTLTRGEKLLRDSDDADSHGLLLGATGATAGFLASSLVNYNYGDAEVALLLWWLMGSAVAVRRAVNR